MTSNTHNITVQGIVYKTVTDNGTNMFQKYLLNLDNDIANGLIIGYDSTKPKNVVITPIKKGRGD